MKLTPLDVRKQTFKRVLRGYDTDEVETFLEMVSAEMEALIKENASLKDKLDLLSSQVEDYRKLEKTLRDSVMTAQKVTDASKQTAEREAELIIREAEAQAERIIDEYQKKAIALKRELVDLKKRNDLYLSRVQSLVDTQLRILKYHQIDMESDDTMPDVSAALAKVKPRTQKAAPTQEKSAAKPPGGPEAIEVPKREAMQGQKDIENQEESPKPPVSRPEESEPEPPDIDSRLLME